MASSQQNACTIRFGKTKSKNLRPPKREVVAAVVEVIEFYDEDRPKERLGFLSPLEFRLRNPRGCYPVVNADRP